MHSLESLVLEKVLSLKVGLHFLSSGKKIAVFAIDPSSPITGGSLLGDKTRMEKLSNSPNAFVRPSPNKMTAGGVGLKTRESILLLEYAGYEIIIIETVGVGQSEVDAYSTADIFLFYFSHQLEMSSKEQKRESTNLRILF